MSQPHTRLAIVGAGIAGAATAELATRRGNVSIDLFERDDRVGGRIMSAEFGPYTVEASALGFWDRYTYLTEYLDRLGLERTRPFVFDDVQQEVNQHGPFLGVWDGAEFTTTVSKSLSGMAAVLSRYGTSPVRLWWHSKQVSDGFERLHDHIETGSPYASSADLVADLGLTEALDQPARWYFGDRGVSTACLEELLDPVLRTIWGHDAGMQSFVAALSVDGMVDHEGLRSVAGGNVRLVEALLDAADVTVHTETPVSRIARGDDTYSVDAGGAQFGPYDAVVVATPLDGTAISFEGVSLPETVTEDREYTSRHIALVDGQLDPAYFGVERREDLPLLVGTTADGETSFTSSVIAREVDEHRSIYRVNGNDPLDDALLEELFAVRNEVRRYDWEAFPTYYPPISLPPFRLADGLYYANAMESLLSTMESEIVTARNIVGLLAEDTADRN